MRIGSGHVAAGAMAVLFFAAAAGADWPGYRGPGGQGHASSDARPPVEWAEGKNIAWKLEVPGKAWSTPVVWGDQVWLSNADPEGRKLEAWCVDRASGKVLKKMLLHEEGNPQYCHPFNSFGSPSPVIEDGRVYITFGAPYTGCIDTKTFEVLWKRTDFVCNHFRGPGSSPLIYNDLLLMHYDGSDYQFAVGLNKKTGETVWKTDRSVDFQDLDPKTGKPDREGDWRKGYSTPLVHDFGSGPVMLSLGSKAFYGYDPNTGKELWRIEFHKSHSGSARPVVGHGMVFATTGARGELLAMKPGGSGVVTDSHVAWRHDKNIGHKPSPLLVDDLIYTIDDNGILTCYEAADGKMVYRERIAGKNRPAATFSASPMFAAGRIYLCDEEGRTTVFEAGRTFKLLAQNDLDGGIMASAAADGNGLILRTKTHLYRIEAK